jgi:hypothetical protein
LLLFLVADGKLDQKTFLEQWKGTAQEHRVDVTGLPPQVPRLGSNLTFPGLTSSLTSPGR